MDFPIRVSYNPAPVTEAQVSLEIIKRRMKEGQCPHCGCQTHKVKKRMGITYKKLPLDIPGQVDRGSCLRESCLIAQQNG
eukprot:14799241-Ditylum_brightwellii.AAC.1